MTAQPQHPEWMQKAPAPLTPAPPWHVGPAQWHFRTPLVMGVVNVTPDSFSDGGDTAEVAGAVARAHRLVAEGADLIDIGGASSHPRAGRVSPAEELRRIEPVVRRLAAETQVPLSIDTQVPAVADACLAAGAHLVNDVSGLAEPAMAEVAAHHDAPLVVTYNNYKVPKGADGLSFLSDLLAFFDERLALLRSQGVRRVILDPGYGFGKTLEENLVLLRALPRLQRFERPILACTSRKGSLGALTGEGVPRERLGASVASSLYAAQQGAHLVRVHDVKAFRQALTTWLAFTRFPAEGE